MIEITCDSCDETEIVVVTGNEVMDSLPALGYYPATNGQVVCKQCIGRYNRYCAAFFNVPTAVPDSEPSLGLPDDGSN